MSISPKTISPTSPTSLKSSNSQPFTSFWNISLRRSSRSFRAMQKVRRMHQQRCLNLKASLPGCHKTTDWAVHWEIAGCHLSVCPYSPIQPRYQEMEKYPSQHWLQHDHLDRHSAFPEGKGSAGFSPT